MKVKFIAFSVAATSIITLEQLFAHIESQKDNEVKINKHDRLIYINSNVNEKYYLGVVVTIKDQKKYCRLVHEKKKVTHSG